MNALRRAALVGGSALLTVGLLAGTASADELGDYLDRAKESTYTANRLIVSVWGDETRISSAFVEHANGTEMVRVDSTWSIVGNGRSVLVNEEPQGVAFVTHTDAIDTGRYTIGSVTAVRHMRRDCQAVEVMEGDLVRAKILFDDHTGAPLITETFTSTGRVYRRSSLQAFKAYRTYTAPRSVDDVEYEIVMPQESEHLPKELAGYTLVDIFPAPGGAEQGFYTDGLFSFSLFALAETPSVTGFENPRPFLTSSGSYDLVATADDVRIHWSDTEHQYVIVGDLPPDHAADVLAELPAPDVRSMFSRWWNRIFG
jgi:hypothetical protein